MEFIKVASDDSDGIMSSAAVESITLLQDENTIHDIRPSWSRWSGALLIGILTSFIGLGLIIIAWVWLKRKNTRYIVTNQRLLEVSGIMGTSTTEYRIADIRQIQTGATWSEKTLGHGNLQFSTGTASMITFNGIPNHQEVANTIREIQREAEKA
jgi:hypothetical protein